MNQKLRNIQRGARREKAVRDGAYDGRFSHKVIQDPKKEFNRLRCRESVELPADSEPKEIQPSPWRL